MNMIDNGKAEINGQPHSIATADSRRLSCVLRDDLGLTGTKIGCNQGDCGSCSVIMDDEVVCACLVPAGRAAQSTVTTVEGLENHSLLGQALMASFLRHQAVQCGFCTPAFLVTATALLQKTPHPTRDAIVTALTGVLCRCTGYAKIVDAILDVAENWTVPASAGYPRAGSSVGAAVTRLDGVGKIRGTELFGADGGPADALILKAVRCPHHNATFAFGDLETYRRETPGLVAIFTSNDIPGRNLHGVAGSYADQPVLAERHARHRGEAVALLAFEAEKRSTLSLDGFPVRWTELQPQMEMENSLGAEAFQLHADRPDNILIKGHVERGDVETALAEAHHVVSARFKTQFVEHAYLEPEAGWAYPEGDDIVVHSCTQAPHAHRADLALILGLAQERVRVVPTGVGGGFGGKLDLTTQPFLALAAWHLRRPVKMVYDRAESIATSTKRHPAEMTSRIAADRNGRITAIDFSGDFNTGAYASWGTAVANRVPVHAGSAYFVPNYRARTRAIHTHITPSGAFRGFGVPQTMICQEQLIDTLARDLKMDQLTFRLDNALVAGNALVTGQVLSDSVGIHACLKALRPRWDKARAAAGTFNAENTLRKRGVGLAAMMYGCGNTAMKNPSTIRCGVRRDGAVVLHQGAVDAGQGSNTVIPQIFADALGVTLDDLTIVGADTSQTPDCGRTSASRQTFVTGNAAQRAGETLRRDILRLSNGGPHARLTFTEGSIIVHDGSNISEVLLEQFAENDFGYVLMAEETFDPDTTPLGENGQGSPYAVYAFGAQIAEVEVDLELGSVSVIGFTAAHDVGRVVNPTLLQGQIEGAIAQGIGQALFEEFVPGKTENFHDYLLATARDIPPVDVMLIEEPASVGPYGAKGIGEPSLVPTAAAVLNAIFDATGSRIYDVPATPERILAAMHRDGLRDSTEVARFV
jgi:aldehyde oxidoreductase